jgi:hypothetical protein
MTTTTLQDLTNVTADGRILFDNLNLSFGSERTGLIGRNGVAIRVVIPQDAGRKISKLLTAPSPMTGRAARRPRRARVSSR